MADLRKGDRVRHGQYGEGTVMAVEEYTYIIRFKRGDVSVSKKFPDMHPLTESGEEAMTADDLGPVGNALAELLDRYLGISEPVKIHDKWMGGKLIMQPGNPSLKEKEVPIDVFFHKVVMLRDRLRVLEQNINSHPKLNDAERVQMQQYVTRCYGSLTTFNTLFKEREDYFTGEKGSGEE